MSNVNVRALSRASTLFGAFVVTVPFLFLSSGAQREKFQPPEGMLTAGLRETERHRLPLSELHIGGSSGGPQNVTFWVHVDAVGRVLEVRDFKTDAPFPFDYRTDAIIESVRTITYRPFLRNGVPVEGWAQDEVEVGIKPAPLPASPRAGANFPALVEPTGFSIQLSRSGCYGTCPSYSVVVHGDGEIEFHGKRYVAIAGVHQGHIDPEAAARLLERFRMANFFGLKDEYRAGVTDNPTYCLQLVVGTKKKTVIDYVGTWVGMPAVVSELEDAADQAAGTERWVSTGPGTLAAMQEAEITPNSKQAGEVLLYAVKEGKGQVVRSLLAAGVPAKVQNANGDNINLLRVASFARDPESQRELFKALLENTSVQADKAGIQEALGHVAGDGNIEVARMLIAAGADPTQLFLDTYQNEGKPDQTYLMRAAASGAWDMIDDALGRQHDIHAVDSQDRSAVGHVVWSAPPLEDIFPLVDRLLAAGAGKQELTRALADACDSPLWRDGLIKRGADSTACTKRRK